LVVMTVAASILLAALVGGVIFVLLDSWQRREAVPAVKHAPERRPEPRTEPLAPPPPSPRRDDLDPPSPLWSGWASR
jgi:hypothetical protein